MTDDAVIPMRDADAPPVNQAEPGAQARFLVFRLENSLYAIATQSVEQAALPQIPIRVPTMPPHYLGVVHMRGRIVTIINLPILLDIGHDEQAQDERLRRLLIVVSDRIPMGILVEEVVGIQEVPLSALAQKTEGRETSPFFGDLSVQEGQFDSSRGVVTVLNPDVILQGLRAYKTIR
jgi:chemotaxis signal transduction protein